MSLSRPALALSAGLFVSGTLGPSPIRADEHPTPRDVSPPDITFFWETPRFQAGDHPLAPFLSGREPGSFQIPELPAPEQERIQFDTIDEPALTPAPGDERQEFRNTYLKPIESFLLRPEQPSGSGDPTAPSLTLRDALYHAFATNPAILVRDLQTQIENDRVAQAEAMFIPTFDLSAEWSESRFPQNAAEAASNNLFPTGNDPRTFYSRNEILRAALKGNTPHATEYEVYSNLTINETTLTRTSDAAIYRDEYTTNIGVRFTQPLRRGYGQDIQEAPIRIARIDRKIAAAELETELTALAVETLEAYFQLIDAFEIHELRQWERETYHTLADIIQRRVETGDTGPRDLIRMRIRMARVEDRILQANEQLAQARHRLFGSFGESFPFDEYSQARPVGEMSPYIPDLDLGEVANEAVSTSSEMDRYRFQLEREREHLSVARDEAKPSLNFIGGIEMRGLGNDPYDSLTYSPRDERLGFNVGLVYSRPINDRGVAARVREARTTIRQTELEIADTERSIRHRILGEMNRLRLLEERLTNTSELLDHIGEEIHTENLLLETGETSLYSLLEFYEDLFHARSQVVGLLREINVTKARFWAADDSLLDRLGIEYSDSSTIYAPPPAPPPGSSYLTPRFEEE